MAGTTIVARSETPFQSAQSYMRLEYNKLIQDLAAVTFNAGVLAISAGGAATVKTTNAVEYVTAGVIARLAAATLPALSGTISTNNFGGWLFTVNTAGTVTPRFMTQAATLAAVTFPAVPVTDAILGYVRLNPTTAPFVGGTTLLDAANTNAIYVDTPAGLACALGTGTGVAAQVTSPVGA